MLCWEFVTKVMLSALQYTHGSEKSQNAVLFTVFTIIAGVSAIGTVLSAPWILPQT
jgi:hypothetical protein